MRGAFFLAMVLLALVPTGMVGCASVEGLIVEDRLGDACRLSKDDGGFFRDHDTEVALLRDAVQSRITVNVVGLDDAEVGSLLGERLREGKRLPLAWLTVSAPAILTLHEQTIDDDLDAMARLEAALPPLLTPPPPQLPPGPLEMPPAPDPTPPRATRSSSSSGGGLLGAFVQLVTLPFRAAAAVGEALIRIPFDLFGAHAPYVADGSSASTATTTTDPRLPGEAILPPEAWAAAKQRLLEEHAAASAAVDAARALRHQHLVALTDRLRERCVVVDGVACRRLVLVSQPSVTTHLSVGLGSETAPCQLDDGLALTTAAAATATTTTTTTTVADPASEAGTSASAPVTTADALDVAVLDAAAVRARLKSDVDHADSLDALACHIEVKPRWRRLVKTLRSLQVRLATGSLAGRGASTTVASTAIVDVGIRQTVLTGDHVKVVVGGDDGFVGGATGRFDGALPLRLDGENVTATCR